MRADGTALHEPGRTGTATARRAAGKVVVITGAARGQGAAEARALAAEGALVVATDMVAAADVAPGELDHRRDRLPTARRDPPGRLGLPRGRIEARYGQVHGLVNNAGVGDLAGLLEVQLGDWERTFRVNTTGPLLGIQALVPLMAAGRLHRHDRQRRGAHAEFHRRLHRVEVGGARPGESGQPRTRTARHPLQPDPSRLHRDRHGGRRSARVPAGAARRQSPRHPRRAGRRGALGRLPDQRRVPVRLRRGDRRRRRVHRTSRRQVALSTPSVRPTTSRSLTPAPDGCSARRHPPHSIDHEHHPRPKRKSHDRSPWTRQHRARDHAGPSRGPRHRPLRLPAAGREGHHLGRVVGPVDGDGRALPRAGRSVPGRGVDGERRSSAGARRRRVPLRQVPGGRGRRPLPRPDRPQRRGGRRRAPPDGPHLRADRGPLRRAPGRRQPPPPRRDRAPAAGAAHPGHRVGQGGVPPVGGGLPQPRDRHAHHGRPRPG